MPTRDWTHLWTHLWTRSLRSLLRTPGFTALAVTTLGLAIGAVVGIFAVVHTVLLDPLPYDDAERIVYIAGSAPGSDFPEEFSLSLEFLVQYRERSELLEAVAPLNDFTSTLRTGDRVERIRMSAPTIDLFAVLGVDPIRGRLPTEADGDEVVVISHLLWSSWFGSDEEVIGRSYSVSGKERTVIGVMPKDFFFPNDRTLLWFPQLVEVEEIEPGRFGQPLVARLAPGATIDEVKAELALLARGLPERFGGSANYARLIEKHRPVVRPLQEELLGDVSGPLWILLAAMGLVLLIACANVANLFLVRAERRQPDLAVHRALGAGRGHLVLSQLAEAGVVALLAGGLAVALARLGVPVLVRFAPGDISRLGEVSIGPVALAFTFGVSMIAALLCGLAPALRFSSPSLSGLREGGRGSVRRSTWGRHVLVVAQTAAALVLLVGSALLLRSFQELRQVNLGYDTEDRFTFQIAPEGEHLQDAVSFARFHLDFRDHLAALPGVESVGIVENVPLDEGVSSQRFRTPTMPNEDGSGVLSSLTFAGPDYFRTMGIDLFRGRGFERSDQISADGSGSPGNVVVSRSAADLLWPGEDAIGRRLQAATSGGSETRDEEEEESWLTVIGVVADVRQYGFRSDPEPMIYLPMVAPDAEESWTLASPAYVLKTPRAAEIAPEIRALVRQVAPSAPMYRAYTMAELVERSTLHLRFTLLTLCLAAGLALVLGIVGLYGVLSYAVAQRTREIGLRMALGADAGQLRRMVVGQGARLMALGVVVGIVAALGATRTLATLLYGVGSFDAGIYLVTASLLLAVGCLASYLPARRASSVDPMESLRVE